MLLASKAASAGIVFILLAMGISGPRPIMLASGTSLSEEVPIAGHPTDVNKMQETLRDKGHYRGKIDGAVGLRTRASIRAYQKAENLPVTGRLDTQTAGGLGLRPEERDKTHETVQGKPSAGIRRARRSGRTSNTPQKAVGIVAAPERGRTDLKKTLQAESANRAQ
jgi:peptidoglycan hydrolase-like protein with peptidoglycan-binding domain